MANKKLNIVLANASIDNANMGCVALGYSFIVLLDKILKSEKIQYSLYAAGYYKNIEDRHLKIKGLNIAYKTIKTPIVDGIKSFCKNAFYLQAFLGSKKAYKTADILFDIGEGDSFSDIYGQFRFESISKVSKIALKYKLPHCFLPQTIGPFNNPGIKKKATDYLTSAEMVMVRDKISHDVATQLSPNIKPKEYIDLAFMLPFSKYNFNPEKVNIGINVSALLWNGGYTKGNQFKLKDDYQTLIKALIETLLEENDNVQIHLVSHVFGLDKDGIENDFSVMTDLYQYFNDPRITLAPLSFNPIDVKSYIAGLDFFIGSRMHATIAAFSSGVPVVPLAYSRKFNGLFMETLDYPYMSDLKTQTKEEVISTVLSSFRQRNILKTMIQDRLNNIVNPRLELIEEDVRNILIKFAK